MPSNGPIRRASGNSKRHDRWGAGGDPPGVAFAPRLPAVLPLNPELAGVRRSHPDIKILCADGGTGRPLGRPTKTALPFGFFVSWISGNRRWFFLLVPVVGVRRTTATVSAPARVAAGDPLFGGFFFGVQPSGFGPLGRMVEGSPDGSPFAGPDLSETLPGN